MAFGLTIGTERATVLQQSIQDELTKRGYSPDADPVMAEYITIMLINNKSATQISSELEDLIGSEFDSSFVDWLFAEVAKTAPEAEASAPAPSDPTSISAPAAPTKDSPPHLPNEASRRPPSGPRAGPLYQQAIAQALPSTSPGQKRTASARSPSPGGHVHKQRRLDLPTGPRAMQRDRDANGPSGSRSLLERMGNPRNGPFVKDDIQARIDSITAQNPEMAAMMMSGVPGPFPMNGMPGMDMAALAGMANPMMLQEMMMNQMALMTQMAGAMGILNPAAMGMNGPFPMQPGMDMNAMHGMNGQGMDGRGRGGRGRGNMRGRGGGRGGHTPSQSSNAPDGAGAGHPRQDEAPAIVAPTPAIAAPAPAVAPQITPSTSQNRPALATPERPQSPTLCKFGLKCANAGCRYSHPSPVATPESGVVLSNDPCENGKNCKDKDCIKAHVSPAVLKATGEQLNPKAPVFTPAPAHPSPAPSHQSQIPCRFGAGCTRPGCTFMHPHQKTHTPVSQPCRFGTACTKAACPYQHPEGRVLPTSFHRGLSTNGGFVSVPTPETGSMSTARYNKSVTFNKPNGAQSAAELERKVKEVEEKKLQAQQAVAQAQAAAAGKKDDAKPVTISA